MNKPNVNEIKNITKGVSEVITTCAKIFAIAYVTSLVQNALTREVFKNDK